MLWGNFHISPDPIVAESPASFPPEWICLRPQGKRVVGEARREGTQRWTQWQSLTRVQGQRHQLLTLMSDWLFSLASDRTLLQWPAVLEAERSSLCVTWVRACVFIGGVGFAKPLTLPFWGWLWPKAHACDAGFTGLPSCMDLKTFGLWNLCNRSCFLLSLALQNEIAVHFFRCP